MIENSKNVGFIPEYIIEQIASPEVGNIQSASKVKRRRSGSLTSNYFSNYMFKLKIQISCEVEKTYSITIFSFCIYKCYIFYFSSFLLSQLSFQILNQISKFK